MKQSIIDVNIYLSRWPTRRLPLDAPRALVAKLREQNVEQAWAGSFDALLHKDIGAVNARLVDACRRHGDGLLRAVGAVNPKLPDWREDLRRCHEQYGMAAVRLHPNYHGYRLDEPVFAELLDACREAGLIVQIAVKMEDERTQHPRWRAPAVECTPLIDLLKERSSLRIVLLNSLRTLRGDAIGRLATAGQVYFEIAMLEGVGGVEKMLQSAPAERLLFGSYAPFFNFESARLKLHESELAQFQRAAISRDNALALLR